MKNISEILNSITTPTDAASLLTQKGGSPVAGKGSSNGNSFGDVLTQVAAQNQNSANNTTTNESSSQPTSGSVNPTGSASGGSNTPASSSATTATNSVSGTVTSVSETSLTITESLKVDNFSQIAQAEQTLVSLAAGLARVLGALSHLQSMDPQQVQGALAAATGGNISVGDAQGLLNSIQAIEQKMQSSQNPLLLASDQQGSLLNQMFQQMIQNQQILLGTPANTGASNSTASVAGAGAVSGAIPTTDAVLQIAFSDTNLTQVQQAGGQSSQVFIDLQTFKMSADFVQFGGNQGTGQNSNFDFKPLASTDSLLNSLSQAVQNFEAQNLPAITTPPSTTVTGQATTTNPQEGTTQNLKDLVQLLMQSGVSQAALTTFLNQQTGLANNDQTKSLGQNATMNQVIQSLVPDVQIPPVTTPDSATLSTIKNGNLGTPLVGNAIGGETSIQSSVAVEIQNVELISASGSGATPQTAPVAVFELQANIPMLDQNVLNSINSAVARLNLLGLQNDQAQVNNQVITPIPSATVDQLLNQLAAITPSQNQNQTSLNLQFGTSAPLPLTQGGASVTTQVPPVTGPSNASPTDLLTVNLFNATAFVANGVFTTAATTQSQTQTVLSNNTTNQTGPVNPDALLGKETLLPNTANLQLQTASGASAEPQGTAPLNVTPPPTVPLPVSSAPNVSASIVTGESIKNAVNIQSPTKSDLNNPLVTFSAQFDSASKPLTSEAVIPLAAGSAVTSNLTVANSLDKNNTNSPVVIQANTDTLVNMGASQADKSNSSSVATNGMNNVNSNIESGNILNQISQQVSAQMDSARTISRLNFQLVPESLGRVTVQIALVDQSISARVIVTNPEVREVLHTHLVDLRSALNQAGLQIDQLQVQVQGGGANLLAQYYQFQQEGFGYQSPVPTGVDGSGDPQNPENTGVLGALSSRNSLVDVLA